MKRSAPACLALALALVAPALALAKFAPPVPPAGPLGILQASADRVVPRSFNFDDLPRRAPGSEDMPVTLRPEHEWEEAQLEVEALKANPPYLPPAQFSQFTFDTTPAAAGGNGALSPLAPSPGSGFEGITQGGFIPGEPTVGGGPLNIFTAGNVSVTVTNRDGTNRVETNGATFFGVPAAEGAVSDAQCYYDALRGRFVAVCFTQGTSPANFSNFYLAISKTSDARGAWWLYKLDMSKDGLTATTNWSDYEGLGISDDKIVFSAQQFSFAANTYRYPKFRILDRAAAYSGAALGYVDIVNFAPPVGGDANDNFVTKPARNLTAGDATIYCMCVRTGSGSRVTYRTITGTPAAPVLSPGNLVAVSAYSAPPDAQQQGSATLVATNDCRPTDFYVRNGVLVAAWHSAATVSATTVSAIRLFRMRIVDHVVLTDETFAQAGTFYYYPAVVVDSVGTIFLGFDRSSATEFPSAYATGKRRGDASLQASTLLKAGLSATAQTRWGDYTGIDQDASLFTPGSTSAWYAGQWTKATNAFGTWVNQLSFTYGELFGTVVDDCDGSAVTTGDRTPIAGVAVTLRQGVTTVATTATNALGQYSFGYLESGTYDVEVAPPAGGTSVDAAAGTGATSQTRVSASDVQIAMTNAQRSSANNFVVAGSKAAPATASLAPATRSAGDPPFTLTVNGSGFTPCSVVRLDGSVRATTYVSGAQVTAVITAADQVAGGTRSITVFTPAPGGGTSGGQVLTILGAADTQAPVVGVTAPAGGESWGAGTAHTVTWTATDNVGVSAVDVAWSSDGGVTFPHAIATGIANAGSLAWTLPAVLTTTARVRVIARDASDNAGSDLGHANFAITGFTLTSSAGANGSIAPLGAVVVAPGATPTYTITPATGYHVADVLVNGASVGAATSYTFAAVGADQAISASFAINTYTLTLATAGSGSIAASPSQASYDHGTVVSLTASPAAGWNFDAWSGDASGSVNPLSVTMDAARSITANFSQHLYSWIPTGTAAWATASSWTPARTTPATNDVLVFDNGAIGTVATGVPTQTIGQLVVRGSTNVTLQAAAAVTLTIAGGAGDDLDVGAGSTLGLGGASAVTLALGGGATGSVLGTTSLAGGAHRLTATDPGSLLYGAGSMCVAGTGFTGNAFGTTSLGSVVFGAGSLYQHVAGANPFGAPAPGSVVTFLAGSRYRLDAALTPSMAGRGYADFEYNNPGTQSPTGGTAVTLDSLVVTQGTLNLNLTGGVIVHGDVHVKPGATLGFSPASGTPAFALAGTVAQSVDVQGVLNSSTNAVLTLNNPAGAMLASDVAWNGGLTFLAGRLATDIHTLTLAAGAAISGASQLTGWVNGRLRQNFATGAFASTLTVGDAATYAPIDVSGTGAGAGFSLSGATAAGDHPNLASSGLDPARSANRSWTLAPANAAGAAWSATFNFAASDLDPTADPGTFGVRVYDGVAWSPLIVNALTGSFTQVSGLSAATAGTQFALGNLPTYTISTSAGPGGSIAPGGVVSVTEHASQAFALLPNPGFHVADVLVDGGSVGAVAGYTFTDVVADHTIAASFLGDPRALIVNVVGAGSVTRSPDLLSYPHLTTVHLTAVPATGWAFSAWSGSLTGTNNPDSLVMDDVKIVNATMADTAAPVVTVTAPNGAEVLTVGTPASLTWTATDNAAVTAVDLDLSWTGVDGPFQAIASGIANSGTYSWTVTGPVSTTARLRATAHDGAGHTAQDLSDADFAIAGAAGLYDGPVTEFALSPVGPNPVRGPTRFHFALPREASVRLSVHDVQGRERFVVADGPFAAGRHSLEWAGPMQALDPGIYFVRLAVPGRNIVRRFVLLR